MTLGTPDATDLRATRTAKASGSATTEPAPFRTSPSTARMERSSFAASAKFAPRGAPSAKASGMPRRSGRLSLSTSGGASRATADQGPPINEPVDFFMVWTKTGWAPRKHHVDFDSAATEAIRLAGENPGKKFIVLRAVAKFHVAVTLPMSDCDTQGAVS